MGLGAPLHRGERRKLTTQRSLEGESLPPILLYDGSCGVCARSVQFILRRDRRKTLRFASLEGRLGQAIVAAEPALAGVDSLVWIEPRGPVVTPDGDPAHPLPPARILVRSRAVLEAGRYLGGPWRLLSALGRAVPRPLRDWGYDLFARNRHRVTARTESCLLPSPEERLRFLDGP
jgi:predicted DCC family thiol-disulfide oxidoreductase YuxK